MTSILEREINEQPARVADFLKRETPRAKTIAQALRGRFTYIVIAARGSSDNAARYAQYLFGLHLRVQVALATPSLFTIYAAPPDLTGALVIGISQSGQSPDIVAVLVEARKQNRPTLAITNDPASPLAQTADFILPLDVGAEQAIAATKTYTTSLAALALLACSLIENGQHRTALEQVPHAMEQTLQGLETAMQRVERYRYIAQCVVIGRGINYSTAFETALKIKELTRVVAEPYSSADFLHGPIATAQPGFPVVVITPRGAVFDDTYALIRELQQRRADLLVISDDPSALVAANLALPFVAGLPEWLSPLVAILPGQRLAMQLTLEKGLDPDHPEGLHKITETF